MGGQREEPRHRSWALAWAGVQPARAEQSRNGWEGLSLSLKNPSQPRAKKEFVAYDQYWRNIFRALFKSPVQYSCQKVI